MRASMNLIKSLFLITFSFLFLSAQAQESHPFSPEDLVNLKRISDPQISPNGRFVAYVVRETDLEENRGRSDIWLVNLGAPDAPPRQLTTDEENDVKPRWSRDSNYIYFISTRSESAQVWMIPIAGGEARQVTDFPVEVSSFALSPKDDRLAFAARVYPECETLQCSADRAEEVEEAPEKGRVYNRLIMRFWDTWRDGTKSQLFVMRLREGEVDGDPVNLTRSLSAEVPAYPNAGGGNYTFTADGRAVIFSTKLQQSDESWSTNSDLYQVRVNGKGEVKNLTKDNRAADDKPVVSPDGRWLAWLASEGAARYAAENKIKLMNLATGEVTILVPGWDRSPGTLQFTKDSSAILATANDLGQQVLFYLDIRANTIEPVDFGAAFPDAEGAGVTGWISSFTSSDNGIVFARHSLSRPGDLYYNDDTTTRRITNVNAGLLAETEMGAYQQFSFEGAHGEVVYGHIVQPVGFSMKNSYPVALIIHGGPHGSMGNSFSYRWNPQTYAGAGYAVVFIDFHGSTGYGQAFVESIHGDRGGATLLDNQLGLAAALQKFPWLDGSRVCALGASFGGYMMNIIEGAWPDRFKCLVNHDGMFDNRMKYFSGDIIGYLEEGFGGRPYFEDPASHEMFNPANQVDKWQTPMLVIHSELDYRVPITQGIGAFTALQRKGIPSRFLYFPNENHWVQKPANSLQWHGEVLRWLDQWLKD